jgi:hypothetical protein
VGDATDRVILTLDRSKAKAEQADFNASQSVLQTEIFGRDPEPTAEQS